MSNSLVAMAFARNVCESRYRHFGVPVYLWSFESPRRILEAALTEIFVSEISLNLEVFKDAKLMGSDETA
ncbi:hypothetical protein Y032_0044g952 [Ancylostoma ceylanicum]|uniref:Uncharacterized protein n=1 Tax=Ancylostoma ceylanicum TaxID=53326 RepID=A0A016UDG6_9BILA|nr:hypothetical protein Y032_0044g952 [Ancylostoma ceylanicum]